MRLYINIPSFIRLLLSFFSSALDMMADEATHFTTSTTHTFYTLHFPPTSLSSVTPPLVLVLRPFHIIKHRSGISWVELTARNSRNGFMCNVYSTFGIIFHFSCLPPSLTCGVEAWYIYKGWEMLLQRKKKKKWIKRIRIRFCHPSNANLQCHGCSSKGGRRRRNLISNTWEY